jgi:hypothetical protein
MAKEQGAAGPILGAQVNPTFESATGMPLFRIKLVQGKDARNFVVINEDVSQKGAWESVIEGCVLVTTGDASQRVSNAKGAHA